MAYTMYPRKRNYRARGFSKPYGRGASNYPKRRKFTRNTTGSNTHTVTAHNAVGYSPSTAGQISQVVKLSDVTSCPVFQQFQTRYTKFRIKWISVKLLPSPGTAVDMRMYTVLCRDDTDPLANESAALRNVSLVMHDAGQTEKTHSRSMKLIGSQYSEWIRCSEASTVLSTGPYQASIKFLWDNLMTDSALNVYTSFGVEFMGLADDSF